MTPKMGQLRKNTKSDKFKNSNGTIGHMAGTVRVRIPLLCVDKSDNSKKAVDSLLKSNKKFEVRQITKKSEHRDLRPPVLFSVEGVFRGVNAIDAYAASFLGLHH